ncbi:MAG: hypothetical protein ABI675_23245 [Chitinophagaceae bacterium]
MRRRTFIMATIAVAATAAVPIIGYRRKHLLSDDPLMRPNVLAHFCDGDTIRDIGVKYRTQVPLEDKRQKLVDLLLTKNNGEKVESSNYRKVSELLENKIQSEFKTGKIIVEDGWVLSETEARQCALFSFSEK